ncbi:hypothetical protein SAMN05421738_1126 [Algoriella xinjiangensis]|uniref:Uncharacterized protein n=1 Tax=Algoriella xinjiangensis TaxID=684065 RepID=A0A1I4YUU1_9FLAO|nr:hypothetical protein [Algoriella xinjiangensis]SFN41727.1 hypothetical protein SAMN05421738_1126 [Algoriella xinjiangensis]
MNDRKLSILGKSTFYFTQFYRYVLIAFVLAIIGVGSLGIGGLWGRLIYKYIKNDIVKFDLSIYKNFEGYINRKVKFKNFIKFYLLKLFYN